MSTVERIMELSDQTFASRDALALLALIFDMRGCSGAELAAAATELGLATTVPYDAERHGHTGGIPGDRLTFYSDQFLATINIGRERLAARFPAKAH